MRGLGTLTGVAESHRLTAWLFLRLLALIYFAAFLSLGGQLAGLVGSGGILPVAELLDRAREALGSSAWWRLPTLLWINTSDWSLYLLAAAGCGFSLLLLFAVRQTLALVALFVLYLSLHTAGQVFLNFQWDYLLLETGFLAIFLGRVPSRLVLLLFHWLLFRLRFLSGLSKLLSGDPSWSGLTALNYYFETQPLPHMGAWYAHQLPEWVLQSGVVFTLFVELIVPFFIFLPRHFRWFAAGATVVMQLCIIATSNHNFINLLTILLCLLLLDDGVVSKVLPDRLSPRLTPSEGSTGPVARASLVVAALITLSVSGLSTWTMISGQRLPRSLAVPVALLQRYGIGHVYHVFPTMQTERHELVIEGSSDGVIWKPYVFRYKPGSVERTPQFIVPHQPRLDWMMWFVPAHMPESANWFNRFMTRLWEGAPAVTDLLDSNPFEGSRPRYLRALVYRYAFTDRREREQTGNPWRRRYLGVFPEVPPRRP
ncbi:MAG: lipase maturation factor family protein [Gammaproteobacteria bacterium]|nr:lipase maturation factor family protein [Gammaproteobacteria bacterium]